MATYGEIVEPLSRTAWEDWDDVTSEDKHNRLECPDQAAVPDIIESLILLEGKYLYDCMKNEIKNLTLIYTIKEIDLNVYQNQQSNVCISILRDYDILRSSEIVELLKPYITVSKNVVTIQTKPLTEYQSLELTNKNCLIRTICSTKASNLEINFPKLQQPNFISGVSAGAICLRDHLDLPGTAVICYTEHPEDYQIEEIQTLLKKLKVISHVNTGPSNVLNSNLYI
ncbi:unnamed protein product [Chilo suppressalis]|uniref:Proteasome assembly chaperone 1 n=1 Tax=Chilo suppressalis TaxID=168631 RepID=A0ABN8AXK7_CHISP|nr:hypothetical protein evm_010492 [Chilo suppressalis]CAH0399828.1 unnamed protein product [Chilo suppressalis]